jgi:hypothetical protein
MSAFPTPSPALFQTRSDSTLVSNSPSFSPLRARDVAPFRVAGYARVPTALQRDKNTIATQKDLIEQFCFSNGYTLTEINADDGEWHHPP